MSIDHRQLVSNLKTLHSEQNILSLHPVTIVIFRLSVSRSSVTYAVFLKILFVFIGVGCEVE